MRRYLAAILLLPTLAFAQTYTFSNGYSPWTPWDTRIKFNWFVALQDASGTEINRVATSTLFSSGTVTVTFPPQVGSVTVAKVVVGFTETGTTGAVQDLTGGWSATWTLPTTFPVQDKAVTTLAYVSMTSNPVLTATVVASAPPPPPPAPTVLLTANPTSVASGAASILTWSSTNATSCLASVAWTGSKATSGSQSSGPLAITSN